MSRRSEFTDDQLDELSRLIDKSITDALRLDKQKAQRVYRNWANQYDPKSDLVRVTDLDDQQLRNLIEHLIVNCEHFHFAGSCDGIAHMIQCDGKAFKRWQTEAPI